MSRALGVRLRPEEGEELVAAHPRFAGDGEQGEEGDTSTLHGGAGERAIVLEQRSSAEGTKPEHPGPVAWWASTFGVRDCTADRAPRQGAPLRRVPSDQAVASPLMSA